MHNNYYLLRQLVPALAHRLQGAVLMECFSQDKDELILSFETPAGGFFIKAGLGADFSCLSFPKNFERARRNSVDLFEQLPGLRFEGAYQYNNERSFRLNFGEVTAMLFKMHGNKSNLLLIQNGRVTDLFKSKLQADRALLPEQLDRTIDWSFGYFLQHRDRPRETYFTFGKLVWRYLEVMGFSSLTPEDQWKKLNTVRTELERGVCYITLIDELPYLSLVPFGKIVSTFHDPIEALNSFYRSFVQLRALGAEKRKFLSGLQQQHARLAAWLRTNLARLESIHEHSHYRLWADIIMANLDKIPTGSSSVVLNDFYHGDSPVEIKLKPGLSPQKNAEVYYKKARNQSMEVSHLERMIRERKARYEEIGLVMARIKATTTLKELRHVSGEAAVSPEKKDGPALPYKEHSLMGFRIWVGRSAQANDQLLQQYTSKDDLWLHARDVSGSHVIVKHQAGKKFPAAVIERAAQLAAFHSKRKNESLCPVIFTPRKYVRKRKGDPAGTVVVDREEVIMVVPEG